MIKKQLTFEKQKNDQSEPDGVSIQFICTNRFSQKFFENHYHNPELLSLFTNIFINPESPTLTILNPELDESDKTEYGADLQFIYARNEVEISRISKLIPPAELACIFLDEQSDEDPNNKQLPSIPRFFKIDKTSNEPYTLAIDAIFSTIAKPGLVCVDFVDVETTFHLINNFVWCSIQEEEINTSSITHIVKTSETFLKGKTKSLPVVMPHRQGFKIAEYSRIGDLFDDVIGNDVTVCISTPFDTDLKGKVVVFIGR